MRRRWCSDACGLAAYRVFNDQHDWNAARRAAIQRDGGKCVRCGADGRPPQAELDACGPEPSLNEYGDKAVPLRAIRARIERRDRVWNRYQLEVNHIEPRNGGGYAAGCHNHLDNLETLCHPCHVKVTNEQRSARPSNAKPPRH
jgi:5-methylcytosine-specific restriction endonuclease McrA